MPITFKKVEQDEPASFNFTKVTKPEAKRPEVGGIKFSRVGDSQTAVPQTYDEVQERIASTPGYTPTDADLRTIYAHKKGTPFLSMETADAALQGVKGAAGYIGGAVKGAAQDYGEFVKSGGPFNPLAMGRMAASGAEGFARGTYDLANLGRMALRKGVDAVAAPFRNDEEEFQAFRDRYLTNLQYNRMREEGNLLGAESTGNLLPIPEAIKPYENIAEAASFVLDPSFVVSGGASALAKTGAKGLAKSAVQQAVETGAKKTVTEKVAGAGLKAGEVSARTVKKAAQLPEAMVEGAIRRMAPGATEADVQSAIRNAKVARMAIKGGSVIAGGIPLKLKIMEGIAALIERGAQFGSRVLDQPRLTEWGKFASLARDANAPSWMRALAGMGAKVGNLPGAELGAVTAKGAAAGGALGAGFGVATAETPEEFGAALGTGAMLGAGGGLATSPIAMKQRAMRRKAGTIAGFVHDQMSKGAQPEDLMKVDDATMLQAATVQHVFEGMLDIQFLNRDGYTLTSHDPGSAASFDPRTKTLLVNVDARRAPGRTFTHEVGHALAASEVASYPEITKVIDEALGDPARLADAKRQYAGALVHARDMTADRNTAIGPQLPRKEWLARPENSVRVDAEIAKLQDDSLRTYGDPDFWAYTEIWSEAVMGMFNGTDIYDSILKHPSLGKRLVNTTRRIVESMGGKPGLKPTDGKKTPTFFVNLDDVIADKGIHDLAKKYLTARQKYTTGGTGKKTGPSEHKLGVSKEMMGKHAGAPVRDMGPHGKGNDFFEVEDNGIVRQRTRRETRKIEQARADEVQTAMDTQPPTGADDPMVRPRKTISGLFQVTGRKMGDWFYNLRSFSPESKANTKYVEDAIENGRAINFWYQAISKGSGARWERGLRKLKGRVAVSNRTAVPIFLTVTKPGTVNIDGTPVKTGGNVLVVAIDKGAMDRRAAEWAARPASNEASLALWNGDQAAFQKDLITYIDNLAHDRPGEEGVGTPKKNVLNAFIIGDNVTWRGKNPLRKVLKGRDREAVVRSFRLDRIEGIAPERSTDHPRVDYNKMVLNAAPEDPVNAPIRDVRIIQSRWSDADWMAWRQLSPSKQSIFMDGALRRYENDVPQVSPSEPLPGVDTAYQFTPDQVGSPEFQKWFEGSQVVDETGTPKRVYHGTTWAFQEFDKSRANLENDMGRGFYFSSDPSTDVARNYASREGVDLKNRLENLIEWYRDDEDVATPEAATARAEKELYGGRPNTIPVYLSMKNPVKIGRDPGGVTGSKDSTFFDLSVDPETGDTSGTFADLMDSLRQVEAYNPHLFFETKIDDVVGDLYTMALDNEGMDARSLISEMREHDGLAYAQDESAAGPMGLSSSEIIRLMFEEAGYDGIIDKSVYHKFLMEGTDPDTTHYIAFHPQQIKSATGNRGTFDPNDANIARSPDLWADTVSQKITSKDTALNQIPAEKFYSKVPWRKGTVNVDIGGGFSDLFTSFLADKGVRNLVWDPFWRPKRHNNAVASKVSGGQADTATVNNVLNVIKEKKSRDRVIAQAADAINPDGEAYFKIYVGTPGKAPGPSVKGWQNNRPAVRYMPEIRKHFSSVERKGDVIIAKNPKKGSRAQATPDTLGVEVVRAEGRADSPRSVEAQDNMSSFNKEGSVYRGMTQREFNATVGARRGAESSKDYSFGSEGTSFAENFQDAESYVNVGRDDPRKTAYSNYLIEVSKGDNLKKNRQGYHEAHEAIPMDQITRVWEMKGLGDEIVAKDISSSILPKKSKPAPWEIQNKERLEAMSFFTPDSETVVSAALKVGDQVIAAPMHAMALMDAYASGALDQNTPYTSARQMGLVEEGFVTSSGKFVSRVEAEKIAAKANQIGKRVQKTKPGLDSGELRKPKDKYEDTPYKGTGGGPTPRTVTGEAYAKAGARNSPRDTQGPDTQSGSVRSGSSSATGPGVTDQSLTAQLSRVNNADSRIEPGGGRIDVPQREIDRAAGDMAAKRAQATPDAPQEKPFGAPLGEYTPKPVNRRVAARTGKLAPTPTKASGPMAVHIKAAQRYGAPVAPDGGLNMAVIHKALQASPDDIPDVTAWAKEHILNNPAARKMYAKKDLERLVSGLEHTRKIFEDYGKWPDVDYEISEKIGKDGRTKVTLKAKLPSRENSDPLFQLTQDISTICPKQDQFLAIVRDLEGELGRVLAPQERFLIGEMMQQSVPKNATGALARAVATCWFCYGQAGRNSFDASVARAVRVFDHLAKRKQLDDAYATKVFKEMGGSSWELMTKKGKPGALYQAILDLREEYKTSGTSVTGKQIRDIIRGYAEPANALEAEIASKIRGYSQAATSANVPKGYAPWQTRFWDMSQKGRKLRDWVPVFNKIAGWRMNSQSDFRVWHVLDVAKWLTELSTLKGMCHVYTRSQDFIDVFGLTGIKFNQSVEVSSPINMPVEHRIQRYNESSADFDVGYERYRKLYEIYGDPEWNDMNGMPFEQAMANREKNPNDIGTMLVGIDEYQIWWALDNDTIDMMIPYHRGAPDYLRSVERYKGAVDFSGEQHEHWPATKAKAPKKPKKGEKPKKAKEVDIWKPGQTRKATLPDGTTVKLTMPEKGKPVITREHHKGIRENYLAICEQMGIKPRFERFSKHPNYMKLVRDAARNPAEQQVVDVTKIDWDAANAMVERWKTDEEYSLETTADPGVLRSVKKMLREGMIPLSDINRPENPLMDIWSEEATRLLTGRKEAKGRKAKQAFRKLEGKEETMLGSEAPAIGEDLLSMDWNIVQQLKEAGK